MHHLISMSFYVSKDKNGNIHVQNAIMGHLGQHHVHTPKGFKKWAKDIDKEDIHNLDGLCDCGLILGQVKDHEGNVSYNSDFK